MESAFPNSNDVESWLVLKGIDDLDLYSFAHGEHHLSIVRYPKFHEQTIINIHWKDLSIRKITLRISSKCVFCDDLKSSLSDFKQSHSAVS